jgi:transcriptional regulator with XRE-family HTH domain
LRINPIWLDSGKGSPDLKVLNLNDAEIKVLDLYRGLSKEKQEDAINMLDRLNPFIEVDTDMGTRVRLIRKQLGLGQVEVAAKAGIFQTMLSNLERGKKYRTRRVIQLADALDVPPEWLSLGIGSANAKKSRISKPELEFMLTFRTQAPAKQKKVIRWMTSSAGK